MDKLDKINQVRRLLWEAHEILDELRNDVQWRVLDTSNEADLVDAYIYFAKRDISDIQTKMDLAQEQLEREGEAKK